MVDIRFFHLPEKLPGVCGERLDVAALTFGKDGVECQRRLARPGQASEDHQSVPGYLDVDVLEIMFPSAADNDPVVLGHIDFGPSWAISSTRRRTNTCTKFTTRVTLSCYVFGSCRPTIR